MSERFVIVGGDAAGMSAASKARRTNQDMEIIVLERGRWVSYGACGLPYYVKGDIERIEDLVAVPAEKFIEERDIDLRLNREVTEIIPEENSVLVQVDSKEKKIGYDKLLLATGAKPVVPDIVKPELDRVFTLHDLEDGREIRNFIEGNSPRSAVVVGGGYIGIEMAEALSSQGMDVNLIEGLPRLITPFSPETSHVLEEHLSERINVYLNSFVDGIEETESGNLLTRFGGVEINSDMVLMAAGVKPNVKIAEESGVKLGVTGAISTDRYGRTNLPGIFAAGDCAEAINTVTGGPDYVPLALTANRDGRAIGSTVGGQPVELAKIAGTATLKAFDLEVAKTGLAVVDEAEQAGFEPVSFTINTPSRAGYYPGAKKIFVTLVADRRTEKLLGGSMIGKEGVSKRIDTLAASLAGSMTVTEFENLDLSYAPPFGPTWDPLLTAAKVLNGKL